MFSKDNNSGAPAPTGTPSILGSDLTINGNLVTKGEIQLDGTLVGDVNSDTLTIGENAKVEGTILAKELRVSGTVDGELNADKVILTKSAQVTGDVIHDTLEIEMGATVEGNLRRQSPPAKSEPVSSLKPVVGDGGPDVKTGKDQPYSN